MKILMSLAFVIASLVLAGAANADVITETLHGTITSGRDNTFFFAGAGVNPDLTGDSISVTFTYDTGLLTSDSFFVNQPTNQYYYDDAFDEAVSESVTIRSQTFSIFDGDVGIVGDCSGPPDCHNVFVRTGNEFGQGISTYLDEDFSVLHNAAALLNQSSMNAYVAEAPSFIVAVNTELYSDTIDVDVAPATVAEPSTWTFLALGLGGLALAIFRQRLGN